MKFTTTAISTATAVGIALFASTFAHAAGDWERLGCKEVGFNVDRDGIPVGKQVYKYKRIKFKVKRAPIEFYQAMVVFGNGDKQTIKFNQKVGQGAESRPIDLPGVARNIRRVDLLYRSLPTFKGRAEVCVFGKQQ